MRLIDSILLLALAVGVAACANDAVNAQGGGGSGAGGSGHGGAGGGSAGSGGGLGGAGGGQGGAGGGGAGSGGGQAGAGGGQGGAGGGQGGAGGAGDCRSTGCGAGEECCPSTGACYNSACLACCQPAIERCDDRLDNDGDGSTDCADADCAADPACQAAQELCGNGRDDDGDGSADCADSDCVADPACAGPELCDNGLDDDGDGASDCGDSDCASAASCRCALVRCSQGFTCCPGTGTCEPDACLACCQPSQELCDNGVDDDGDGTADCADADCVDFGACRCMLVRCAQGFSCCPGTGTCEPDGCGSCCGIGMELCGNGVDDDGDGLVDCGDGDCAGTPGCSGEICDNHLDDDLDGVADCFDPDCFQQPSCDLCANAACGAGEICCNLNGLCVQAGCRVCCQAFAEGCDNGIDDDADRLVDCDDPDCALEPQCSRCFGVACAANEACCELNGRCVNPACLSCCQFPTEECGNHRDEDLDGLVDCDDPDCAADPSCAQPDCNVSGCAAGLDCCPTSGSCYDPRCLACCM